MEKEKFHIILWFIRIKNFKLIKICVILVLIKFNQKNMKKINLYRMYLASAIIILIIISSISFYFVAREVVSKKYISEKTYISMFYEDYSSEDCKYNYRSDKKITDEKLVNECIDKQKNTFLEKREYRYKFNMIKYGVLLLIILWLLSIHSFLYLINRK